MGMTRMVCGDGFNVYSHPGEEAGGGVWTRRSLALICLSTSRLNNSSSDPWQLSLRVLECYLADRDGKVVSGMLRPCNEHVQASGPSIVRLYMQSTEVGFKPSPGQRPP